MKEFLTAKKKLQVPNDRDKINRPEKVDRIQLINVDNSAATNVGLSSLNEPSVMVQGQLQSLLQNSLQLNTENVATASKWFTSEVPLGHSTLMNAKMRELMAATGRVEITDESAMIEANTKVMVRRVPYKEWEPIELDYHLDRLVNFDTGKDNRPITALQQEIRL